MKSIYEEDETEQLLSVDDQDIDGVSHKREEGNSDKTETKEESKEELLKIDDEDINGIVNNNINNTNNSINKSYEIDYKQLTTELVDKGIFTVDIPETFTGTPEEFIELTDNEIRTNIEEYKKELDDKYNGILTYLENGGDIKKFGETHRQFNYDSLKEEDIKDNVDNAEKIMRDRLKLKGFTEKEINKQITRAKDYDTLIDDALEILPEMQQLSKIQKTKIVEDEKLRAADERKRLLEFDNTVFSTIDKLEELLPGNKMTDAKRKEIKQKYKNGTVYQKLQTNPTEYAARLAVLDYLGILDGKWDKVLTDVGTSATKTVINKIIKTNKGSGTTIEESKSSAADTLKAFMRADRYNLK